MRWGVLMLEFDCGSLLLFLFYCSRQKGPGGNLGGHACRKLCMTHWS